MTFREGVAEQLEQAAAQAVQERERLWNSFVSNEDAKSRLRTFDRRFMQAAAGMTPINVPQPSAQPDRELVAALGSVTAGASDLDRLDVEAGRAQAELNELATRGKQFWIWVIAILVILIFAAVFLLLRH